MTVGGEETWMDFGGVDLPMELVEAHRAGRLVLFVGAGASQSAGLPDFPGLVNALVTEAGWDPGSGGGSPDDLLARLDAEVEDYDVHARTVCRIREGADTPTALHDALVQLAATSPTPRVVTTNYDVLLTKAAARLDVVLPVAEAPALPLGSDFEGLVHLHGSVDGRPDRCVVTSRDFGRAYLTEGWAARFLRELFASSTVLFVGYSLDDTIVRYLASALPEGGEHSRFALLSDDAGVERARQLGVKPVRFDSADDFLQLVHCMEAWAVAESRTLPDHAAKIREVVGRGAPPVEAAEYLVEVLSDDERIDLFTSVAEGPEWLLWVMRQEVFLDGCVRGRTTSRAARELAYWFAGEAVREDGDDGAASLLWSIEELPPIIIDAVGWTLNARGSEMFGLWAHPWVLLLLRHEHRLSFDWLPMIAEHLDPDRDAPIFWSLATRAATPVIRGRGYRGVRLRDSQGASDRVWARLGELVVRRPAEVFELAVTSIEAWTDLERAAGDRSMVSFGRAAIEPHPEDDHRDGVDPLVELARNAGERLADEPSTAAHVIERCLGSRAPLVVRIGLHLLSRDPSPDGGRRAIERMLEERHLEDTDLHHESMACLAAHARHLEETDWDGLIPALTVDDVGADESATYFAWMRLSWVREHGAVPDRLDHEIARLKAVGPNWERRDHPDLLRWSSGGGRSSVAPCTPSDFEARVEADPGSIPDWLDSFGDRDFEMDVPTSSDAAAVIVDAVEGNPETGIRIWDAADGDVATQEALISGWARADLSPRVQTLVLERVTTTWDVPRLRAEASWMLGRRTPVDWTHSPDALRFVASLTLDSVADPQAHTKGPLVTSSTPDDGLVDLLIVGTYRAGERGDEEGKDAGLASLRCQLTTAVPRSVLLLGSCRWLNAIAALDEPLAKSVIERALLIEQGRQFDHWSAHLIGQHPSVAVTRLGYLDALASVWHRCPDDAEDVIKGLAGRIVGLWLRDDEALGSVQPYLRTNSRTKREQLYAALRDWLHHNGSSAAAAVGGRVNEHLVERTAGVPRRLVPSEMTAIDSLLPLLGEHYASAVEIMSSAARRSNGRCLALRELSRADITVLGADAMGQHVAAMLKGTQPPFWDGRYVRDIVGSLSATIHGELLRKIQHESLRLGLRDAMEW
jgi:hypothetical protein